MAGSGKTMAITKAIAKRIFKPAPDFFLLEQPYPQHSIA
jgi:hypothetical protein